MPEEPHKSAVLYARVSSKDQEREGYSIPAQLDLLRFYAAKNDLTVINEYVDIETAKQAGRSGFGQMLAALKRSDNCHDLLVEKTDRLYRHPRDWVSIEELSLTLHLVKENVVLTPESRSSEKFMHGIKVLMAKNYIDNLSEESRKGMLEKALQGMWPSNAPLGYKNVDGPDGKRIIVPDPERATIVRRMFERYATGNYSLKEISALARADGLVFQKSGAPVPTSTVHKILRNRIYTGDFDFDGVTYPGKYEPIITRELWQIVQEMLDGRGKKKRRTAKHDYPFSGFLTCVHCGCALVGEMKKGRYMYYHCTGHKGKCPEPYTRQEALEQEFLSTVKAIRFSDDVLAWAEGVMYEHQADEIKQHEAAISRLASERQRIQSRMDAMYLDKLDGHIDNDFFDRMASEFHAQQARITEDIATHEAAIATFTAERARIGELARRAATLFEAQPAAEKRKLLNFVIAGARWGNGRLEAEYRKPFDLIADSATIHDSLPKTA